MTTRPNFRIGKATFRLLCTQLCASFQRRDVVRRPLSVEERIAITLWRLRTNIEYRSIAHLFGVGLSTVCVVVYEVCASIVNTLSSRYIRIPTGEDAQTVVDGFLHTWGFPQCFGAIDGSHIPIIAPSTDPLDYDNRKGFHFLVLQTLVDHEYKFMNISSAGQEAVMMHAYWLTLAYSPRQKKAVSCQLQQRTSVKLLCQ